MQALRVLLQSLSPDEPCLVESLGLVLVSSISSDLYNLSEPLSMGFPRLLVEGPHGDIQFRLSPHHVSGPLHLLSSDDDWTRHQFMSIAEYTGNHFIDLFYC